LAIPWFGGGDTRTNEVRWTVRACGGLSCRPLIRLRMRLDLADLHYTGKQFPASTRNAIFLRAAWAHGTGQRRVGARVIGHTSTIEGNATMKPFAEG